MSLVTQPPSVFSLRSMLTFGSDLSAWTDILSNGYGYSFLKTWLSWQMTTGSLRKRVGKYLFNIRSRVVKFFLKEIQPPASINGLHVSELI